MHLLKLTPGPLFQSIILPLLCALAIAQSPAAAAAEETENPYGDYLATVKKAQADYRKGFAASLSKATKIEILLLDFDAKKYEGWTEGAWEYDLPKDLFSITPYKSVSRILKTKVLTAEEMKRLLPALQATVGVENYAGGAMCHFPIHGLRVWEGERMIFHTSFCWMCRNFYFEYPDFTVRWIGIEGTKLKEVFTGLMPIPQAELDRFQKAHNGPNNLQ